LHLSAFKVKLADLPKQAQPHYCKMKKKKIMLWLKQTLILNLTLIKFWYRALLCSVRNTICEANNNM